jgi:hypothetical protein
MLRGQRIVLFATALLLTGTGCRSHKAKVAELQKQYDKLNEQFGKDCSSEFLKVPPTLSPKCSAEDKQVKGAWDRLQAERTKD